MRHFTLPAWVRRWLRVLLVLLVLLEPWHRLGLGVVARWWPSSAPVQAPMQRVTVMVHVGSLPSTTHTAILRHYGLLVRRQSLWSQYAYQYPMLPDTHFTRHFDVREGVYTLTVQTRSEFTKEVEVTIMQPLTLLITYEQTAAGVFALTLQPVSDGDALPE